MQPRILLVLIVTLGLFASACGSDDKKETDTTTDTTTDMAGDTGTDTPADTSADTPSDTPGDTPGDVPPQDMVGDTPGDMTGDCTYEGHAVEFESALLDSTMTYFVYAGDSGDVDPIDTMYLEFYTDSGAPLEARMHTFTGENYDTCVTCLTIEANCTGGVCTQTYLARSGALNITAASAMQDGAFTASLTDLVLDEVTIDEMTGTSTVVPGGDVWCIGLVEIDTTIDVIAP